jgi:DNA polymerase-3 subunit epsilon
VLKNGVIDTVMLARQVHPGARVSLDALCKHYGIDNSKRTLHGALLDSEILADVYLELIGGRQLGLALGISTTVVSLSPSGAKARARQRPTPLPPRLDAATASAHAKLLESLKEPLWGAYAEAGE